MSLDYLSGAEDNATSNFKHRLPRKRYLFRAIDAVFAKVGEKKTPLITVNAEIIYPSEVTVKDGDEELTVDPRGTRCRKQMFLTAKTASRVLEDCKGLAVEPPDSEEPDLEVFKGKYFYALATSDVTPITDEEDGEPILDANDEPMVRVYHNVTDIIKAVDADDLPASAVNYCDQNPF